MSQWKSPNDTLNEVWKVNRCMFVHAFCLHFLNILAACVLINNYDRRLNNHEIFLLSSCLNYLTISFSPLSMPTFSRTVLIFFFPFLHSIPSFADGGFDVPEIGGSIISKTGIWSEQGIAGEEPRKATHMHKTIFQALVC